MGKYTVKSYQNIYDVATTIYGSIEGVFDLLMSNPNLSVNDALTVDTELAYHETFVLNEQVRYGIEQNAITIANSEHQVYPCIMGSSDTYLILITLNNPQQLSINLIFFSSGTNKYTIDWGDGEQLTEFTDESISLTVSHYYSTIPTTAHVWLTGRASNISQFSASGAQGYYYYLTTINQHISHGTIQ